MGYLQDFQKQIIERNFNKFFQLWEEYCTSDSVDPSEFIALLKMVKESDFATPFGQIAETALPLWNTIEEPEAGYEVLKLLIDLQTTNSQALADVSEKALTEKYGEDPKFRERTRQVGLRSKRNFQGALSNYDLLAHMAPGRFVYHTAGWGTGEISQVAPLLERVSIEFEYTPGIKHLVFANAYKTLIPLNEEHFLARRFADPDALEEEARGDPLSIIKLLLQDLGPKTATEIKEELCILVIPEEDWSKWWQNVRTKLKKDTYIETPKNQKKPFSLRLTALSHEDQLKRAIQGKEGVNEILLTTYNYVRDVPNLLKNQEVKQGLIDQLIALLDDPEITQGQKLQIYLFLDHSFGYRFENDELKQAVLEISNAQQTVDQIEILAFKKKALTFIRKWREDWISLFLDLLFTVQQNPLRDYLLKELNQEATRPQLLEKLTTLMQKPHLYPEAFYWYFQKLLKKSTDHLPFHNKEGQSLFFEAFMTLLHQLESRPEYRDLAKKMYTVITEKRFLNFRSLIAETPLAFVQEILLLASKSHCFTPHDLKILRSLAEVVHPSLSTHGKKVQEDPEEILWTTEEGYRRTHERIKQISTVEMVSNAKEIEVAREHGDLRENSEYKFAKEKRAQLQRELHMLSQQFNKARIITPDDIPSGEVGVGSIVEVTNGTGEQETFTILGPWDADPDKNILSFQSKLAQAMVGHQEGEKFQFKDAPHTIVRIRSYFDQ